MILSFALLVVVAAVTILASNEGAWGAALICVSTLFAGLFAMNFFEPVAQNWLGGGDYADFLALTLLFAAAVSLIRVGVDKLAPTNIELPGLVYDIGRFGFGAIAGYITMAFLAAALHTAPIPRSVEIIGFRPEGNMLFDMVAPDRQWLAFTQYVSEKVFGSDQPFDGPRYQGIPDADRHFAGAMPARWPSFIMRYAARRELYGRAGRARGPGFAAPAQGGGDNKPQGGGNAPPAPGF